MKRVIALLFLASTQLSAADSWLDTSQIEQSWAAYTYVYPVGLDAPLGWTGNVATLQAGTTSLAHQQSVLSRVNFYRMMAGLYTVPTINPTYSAKCQAEAFVALVNERLSHTIDSSWIAYSPDAADGAANSNLAMGQWGVDSVDGYMIDWHVPNVGHRQWLLESRMFSIGVGDTMVQSVGRVNGTNALWIADVDIDSHAIAHRDSFIAWPARGYTPYQIMPRIWTFALHAPDVPGVYNLNAATLSVTLDGAAAPFTLLFRGWGDFGPLVQWSFPQDPMADVDFLYATNPGSHTYHVKIDNVIIAGVAHSYEYDVNVFDPLTSEPGVPAALTSNLTQNGGTLHVSPAVNKRLAVYTLAADGYQNSGDDAASVITTATRGPVVQSSVVNSGTNAFVLTETGAAAQTLGLRDHFVPDPSTTLTWTERFEGVQTFKNTGARLNVEVNALDGNGWQVQSSHAFKATTGQGFVANSLSLAKFAGSEILVRFNFIPDVRYSEPIILGETPFRWYIDDIVINGRHFAESASVPVDPATGANWTPATPGYYRLALGNRYLDQYDSVAGPSTLVAVPDAPAPSRLTNVSIRSTAGTDDQTLIMGFYVAGGTKSLLVRGIGPGLVPYGVPATDAALDPTLTILSGSKPLEGNGDWGSATTNPQVVSISNSVAAFALPDGSKDAVMLAALSPGLYSAQVTANRGIALAELYETENNVPARLTNLSARALVGNGSAVLIAGFNVQGAKPKKLLIRGVGPTLANYQLTNVLTNLRLDVYRQRTLVYSTTKWGSAATQQDIAAAAKKVGAFDLIDNSNDTALLVTLPADSYTAVVSGGNGQTGIALVEVYDAD